ncbi:MAG: bacillithiol system redox-active protein YtxJ [Bacteroidetes bacterium]|nr:bacillithiol system redox-active protein YtxJ [Bacteroidota bacterium]
MPLFIFFISFFSSNEPQINPTWIELNHSDQLEKILSSTSDKAVVIFKHSTRCGISAAVKKSLMKQWSYNKEEFKFYYLDLLNQRKISDQIEQQLEVQHESPQIFVVKDGKVLYHASHGNISIERVCEALKK